MRSSQRTLVVIVFVHRPVDQRVVHERFQEREQHFAAVAQLRQHLVNVRTVGSGMTDRKTDLLVTQLI